jgi:predicted transcriptional regulator of viral defense system
MPGESDRRDVEIAKIAARQHGVITAAQLVASGLSDSTISERARRGLLHRVHRGVYAVGHPGLSREGRWMAAVLAYGEGAALSHTSAAALWGFLRPLDGPVHVSVPTYAGRRRRAGIRIHRCATLARGATGNLGHRARSDSGDHAAADHR